MPNDTSYYRFTLFRTKPKEYLKQKKPKLLKEGKEEHYKISLKFYSHKDIRGVSEKSFKHFQMVIIAVDPREDD